MWGCPGCSSVTLSSYLGHRNKGFFLQERRYMCCYVWGGPSTIFVHFLGVMLLCVGQRAFLACKSPSFVINIVAAVFAFLSPCCFQKTVPISVCDLCFLSLFPRGNRSSLWFGVLVLNHYKHKKYFFPLRTLNVQILHEQFD